MREWNDDDVDSTPRLASIEAVAPTAMMMPTEAPRVRA
jgi:hypothetical protein